MGTIQSGIGLISGLDTASLVDQLIAIEARPRDMLQAQVNSIDGIKGVWLDLSARLLSIKSAAASFDDLSTFQAVSASSSNTNALTVSAAAGAAVGSYRITPARLASTHQVVSAGLADRNTTPVGAGTIAVDFGRGQLNPATDLSTLNGQSGVARGSIRITDRGGSSAAVDLTLALTVQDVLDAINAASGLNVTASVSGDSIVLSDSSGGAGNLTVAEVNGGATAAGLGIIGSVAADTLTGSDVVSVNGSSRLAGLNDGNGVRTVSGDDIKFTLEDGTELLVDLSAATSLADVIDTINDAIGNGGKLVASIDAGGDGLRLTDTTGGLVGPLTVEAVGDSKAATDLGLLTTDGDGDHVIVGKRLMAGLNSVLLRNLNGGAGVAAGSISIQDRGAASAVVVDLSTAQSVADVIDAINTAAGAAGVAVTASLNAAGNGIRVTETSGQSLRNFVIAENGSTTAAQLNILHDDADSVADSGTLAHRYISENSTLAELGVTRGKFTITDSAGHSATVDLTQGNEVDLGDVITEINTRGIGVVASINSAGNGLLLTDTAGGGGTLKVAEKGSTTAADLGILGSDDDLDGTIDGARRLEVAIDADDTLDDVAAAINAAAAGRLSAVVINDGSELAPYRLVITSGTSGDAGRMIIDAGQSGLSFATMSQPRDALLFFGDPSQASAIPIRSRSNTVAGAIQDVTINLIGSSATPVEVTVTSSIDGLVNSLKSFTTSVNSTIDRINLVTDFDIEAGTRGVLQGDATANRIRGQLFSMITGSVSGATGRYSRLTSIGFSVTSNGTAIEFDEDKFRAAYAADPAGVKSLFTLAGSGVGDRIETVLTGMTDSVSGSIHRQVDNMDSRRELLTSRIDHLNDLLDRKRIRLQQQFAAMETALAQLQSQSSALTSLTMAMASMVSSSSASG